MSEQWKIVRATEVFKGNNGVVRCEAGDYLKVVGTDEYFATEKAWRCGYAMVKEAFEHGWCKEELRIAYRNQMKLAGVSTPINSGEVKDELFGESYPDEPNNPGADL